ncbi:unnamed protein product [Caenorhabditis auriculariae]|uniref:RNA polymerase II-associated protein 1 N-terminal domain-containing protein n=1 Tax=Caenorhabditis auriculariae TaxID=2777116 RepID=A0A8S1HC87_9PELO|nr:unnamed protein product [Caenorhabditis auriculariae]
MFIKRPTAEESDDDLQRMQEEWESAKKPNVQVHRMKKKEKGSVRKGPGVASNGAARFTIDLDKIAEESVAQIMFPVQERNGEWLEGGKHDDILREGLSKSSYSKDDGFPEPLDLSHYYGKDVESSRKATPGKSFFAAEFDRIHGRIEENLDEAVDDQTADQSTSDDFSGDNDKYIASLDFEKVNDLKREIQERLDPKLVEFLKSRRKTNTKTNEKPKVSKFKTRREAEKNSKAEPGGFASTSGERSAAFVEKIKTPVEVTEMLNELEVLEEYGNREDREKYNRLATDAVQLDIAAKFGKNVASRQEKNAIRLFDSCKFRPDGCDGKDELLETARQSIEDIKSLYLQEVLVDGVKRIEFAKGVSPILDGCWTLVPVRSVVDAVDKRAGKVLPDDVEIVRLALFWTLLLFEERKSAFLAFADPSEFLVRIAEVFLIGSEMLDDGRTMSCVERLLDNFVLKAAKEGRISLRMNAKVAGLDAFMPFYEDLLKKYEQYSLGDAQFTKVILICAYLNGSLSDSIELRYGIWSPRRSVIRQVTVDTAAMKTVYEIIKTRSVEAEREIDEQHYVQYTALLSAYAAAIRDQIVTRDRNGLMFEIAAFELGNYVSRHSRLPEAGQEPEKRKHIDIFIEVVRKTLQGKLNI